MSHSAEGGDGERCWMRQQCVFDLAEAAVDEKAVMMGSGLRAELRILLGWNSSSLYCRAPTELNRITLQRGELGVINKAGQGKYFLTRVI